MHKFKKLSANLNTRVGKEVGLAMPKSSEAQILSQCKMLLTYLSNKKLLAFKRITVSGIPRDGGKYYTPNKDMEGMPDLLVFIKDGPVLSIEVKSTSGRQTDKQTKWQQELEFLGHKYYIIRNIQELEVILKQHLINY